MADGPIMIVDARNLMYRAIHANRSNRRENYHHFTIMVRFMSEWLDKFKPSSVNMFWDAKRDTVWRRKVFDGYKRREDSDYHADIKEDLIYTQAAAKAIFKHMAVRQLSKKRMEADDLIYTACRVLAPHPVVVVSSDQDYTQVCYRMPHVQLYEPMKDLIAETPDFDPAIQKALAGDKSDKIGGYVGIGPVKGGRLARSPAALHEFLAERGREPFIRNLLLIDLSLCPELLKNILYIQRMFAIDTEYDKKKMMEEARKHHVKGFASDYPRSVVPFKLIAQNSQK